jgi:hypothetical protein
MAFVQGRPKLLYARLISQFALAFAASALVTFGLAAALGQPTHALITVGARRAILVVVFGGALALDAYSLGWKRWCPVTLRRQVPKGVLYTHGARRAAVVWGLDAGLVVSTYRMSAISWALLLLAFAGIAPWWIGAGYAAGFLGPLVLGNSIASLHAEDGTQLAEWLTQRPGIARGACVAALTIALAVASDGLM